MNGSAVRVAAGPVALDGDLTVPEGATGVVAFAHGSGSGRTSPRNRQVSAVLADAGLATLRFDLLTPEEEQLDLRTGGLRFDIALLAERLVGATGWLATQDATRALPVGYFGASTGAAAALVAAARLPERVRAVVCRGGRPDLAGPALAAVTAPVLLIVGGADHTVLELNHQAATQIRGPVEVVVVPGAGHLFEEPGALDEVARLARDLLLEHLAPAG